MAIITLIHSIARKGHVFLITGWRWQVKANPGPISGGMAPIYGAAGKMPDRGTVRELLVEFMDSSC